jgi:LacI family transcriptional regulator
MPCTLDVLDQVIMNDTGSGIALHAQLRRALRTVIERHFEDGQKFFTEAELGERLGTSQGTLRRALLDLTREGLLERRVAKGSFVRKRPVNEITKTVGIFVPAFESPFWAGMLAEFSRICHGEGYRMQVFHTHSGGRLASAYKSIALPPAEMRVLLLGDAIGAAELHRSLDAKGYRTVAVDVVIPGHPGPSVQVDNAAGMRMAVEHLVELGHKNIAMVVDQPLDEGSIQQRVDSFKSQMKLRGIEPRVVDCGTKPGEDAFGRAMEAMPRIWNSKNRPSAICTSSDPGAWAVLKWCVGHGVKIPEELSVVGFDDDRPSLYTFPALTSVSQPVREIAEEAVRQLWSDSPFYQRLLLPPRLVVRESTGRCMSC